MVFPSQKTFSFLPIVFPVWLRDGVALANIPRVICGDSEEVSSEPPRARTPPNDGNYKERGVGGFG